MREDLAGTGRPLVAAAEMGYGHLRAARSIAAALGDRVVRVDHGPVAGPGEERVWARVRRAYETLSRVSQWPIVGAPMRWWLDELTSIPHLHPARDLSGPTAGVELLERLAASGLGSGLVEALRRSERPLVTTFYAPAIVADAAGWPEIHCVVTDTDVNRIWAPRDAQATRIRYLVPTPRAGRRLRQYGVPADRITFTGFPLPDDLVGGLELVRLRRNLAARIARLDPTGAFRREHAEELAHFLGAAEADRADGPPLIVFAVGGAAAQAELARSFLPSLRAAILDGRLRVTLVAGVKPLARIAFEEAIHCARLEDAMGAGLEILSAGDVDAYFDAMNRLLGRADVLWTKPSEMCFYAALGLPLVCAPPVGLHERVNRRWVRENGAGFKQRDPRYVGEWLGDMLEDGALAAAAWAGFTRLPKFGLYRVLRAVGAGSGPRG
jgi:hypothetical protein